MENNGEQRAATRVVSQVEFVAWTGRQCGVEDGYDVLGKGLREVPVFDKEEGVRRKKKRGLVSKEGRGSFLAFDRYLLFVFLGPLLSYPPGHLQPRLHLML